MRNLRFHRYLHLNFNQFVTLYAVIHPTKNGDTQ